MWKNIFKIVLAIVPAACLAASLCLVPSTSILFLFDNNNEAPAAQETQPKNNADTKTINETIEFSTNINLSKEDSNAAPTQKHFTAPWYKAHLSQTEQAIYDELKEGIFKYDSEIHLSIQPDEETLTKCLQYIICDEAECFWISSTFSFSKMGESVVSVRPDYKMTPVEISYVRSEINKTVDLVVEQANTLPTDYDKVKFFYEWLADNIAYDMDCENSQDVQGALYDGISACAGYAHAFQMLCSKVNIPCAYMTGPAGGADEDNIPHAWNAIELGGEVCYVDVTWGDRNSQDVSYDHSWLCVPYDLIAVTHHFEYPAMVPSDSTDKYAIWNVENTCVTNIDSEEAYRVLERSLINQQKTVCLKFATDEEMNAAYDYLLNLNPLAKRLVFEHGDLLPNAYSTGIYALYKQEGLSVCVVVWNI